MKLNLLLSAILLITFSSCKKKSGEEPQPTSTQVQRHVTYRIGCTDCEVVYYKSSMQQATEYHCKSGWTYSFDGVKGDVVLLLAYNTGSVPQGVTATIMLNSDTLTSRTTYCPVSGYSLVTDTLK